MKDTFFFILDLNKDKKVCETDLFRTFKLIQDEDLQDLMSQDVKAVFKHIENTRI